MAFPPAYLRVLIVVIAVIVTGRYRRIERVTVVFIGVIPVLLVCPEKG